MRVRAGLVAAALVLSGCAVVTRGSVAPTGADPNGASTQGALSGDGTVLAYTSLASNLTPGDTNGTVDVFVKLIDGTVERISISTAGVGANGPSTHPSVSGDGRYVAFQSDATNLVANDTNGVTDVFVRDRVAGTTTLVSVPAPGAPAAPANPSSPSVAATAAVSASFPSAAETPAGGEPLESRARRAPVRVIVQTTSEFRPEGSLSPPARVTQRQAIAADQRAIEAALTADGRVVHRSPTLPILVAHVGPGALTSLRRSSRVARITPDDPVPAALVASGPVVGLPNAHDAGYTGRGTAVAILDTGVESSHPFLAGRVTHEACFSGLGSCPNGQTSQVGPGAAAPCTYAPTGCRHGTHVAGIAAGAALAADGVAPRAEIVAIQVFSRIESAALCTRGENPCPLTLPSDWIRALEYLAALHPVLPVAAANLSIGGLTFTGTCDTDPAKLAVDQLLALGTATVIAAGNEAKPDSVGYPGCISTAVTVGATNNADAVATFSNSNPVVDVFAPGVGIRSSVPGGGFANFNGTSMATPHVAGAFALAKEQYPNASVADVLNRIRTTGSPITDPRNGLSFARLCVSGALGFDRCPNPGGSTHPALSADGSAIAFQSGHALVGGDTNGLSDIYVRRFGGSPNTTRVSLATGGAQGDGASTRPSISGTGHAVTFESVATNLVADDTNAVRDVFLRDLVGGSTLRTSTAWIVGAPVGPSRDAAISEDGRAIVFTSASVFDPADTNGVADIYLLPVVGGPPRLVSRATDATVGNGPSSRATITREARFVAFLSDATNLDTDPNDHTDLFVHDRSSDLTQRASNPTLGNGTNGPSVAAGVSGSSGMLTFTSPATDVTTAPDANSALDVFVRALIVPAQPVTVAAPVTRGSTTSFTVWGRGFREPVILLGPAGTSFTVRTVTPNSVTAELFVDPAAALGPAPVHIVNGAAVAPYFGATICPACLTITP